MKCPFPVYAVPAFPFIQITACLELFEEKHHKCEFLYASFKMNFFFSQFVSMVEAF